MSLFLAFLESMYITLTMESVVFAKTYTAAVVRRRFAALVLAFSWFFVMAVSDGRLATQQDKRVPSFEGASSSSSP